MKTNTVSSARLDISLIQRLCNASLKNLGSKHFDIIHTFCQETVVHPINNQTNHNGQNGNGNNAGNGAGNGNGNGAGNGGGNGGGNGNNEVYTQM